MPIKGKTAVARPSSLPYRAIGAYIFAGGFTVGMSRHFHVTSHVEDTRFGVNTFSSNFPAIPVLSWDERGSVSPVDVVYGNPPCSGWSVMGSFCDGHDWAGNRDWRKTRTDCSSKMFDLWRELGPKVWVMESVTQLVTKGRDFVRSVIREASGAGYGTWLVFHDPKFMGIPQTRRRVFFILSRVHLEFRSPGQRMTKVRDVIHKMPPPSSKTVVPDPDRRWLKSRSLGKDFIRLWEEAGSPASLKPKHRTAHRVDPDTPLGTIHSDGHFVHPTETRFLSASELAFLSGFPVTYQWPSSEGRARAEIAKGVTPAAGDWLGVNLARSLRSRTPADPLVVTELNFMSIGPRRSDDRIVNGIKTIPVTDW